MKLIALTLPTGEDSAPTSVPVPSGLPRIATGGLRDSIGPMISTVLNFLFIAGVVLAVIFILVAGIRYITSQGEPQKIAEARQSLMYAIIGLVIVIASYFIVSGVLFLVGAQPRFFWNLGQP